MRLTIAYNEEKKGIECYFLPQLDKESELFKKLTKLGFKQVFTKAGLWYIDNTPAYNEYTKNLKAALENGDNPLEVLIEPSYHADESFIDHDKFSYVTIYFSKEGKVKHKSFVVFDQYKKVATEIAEQFGKEKYGDSFLYVDVLRRGKKGDSRTLLLKGKVIGRSQTYLETAPKKNKSETKEVETQKDTLKNEHGVYTEETAKDRLEIITIDFPKSAKYSAEIKLVRDQDEKYRFGISQHKEFGDASGSSSPVSDSSTQYPTKLEALTKALEEIASTIKKLISQRDSIVSNQEQKNKYLKKALETTYSFAMDRGIDLSKQDNQEVEATDKKQSEENPITKPYVITQSWSEVDKKWITALEDFIAQGDNLLHFHTLKREEDGQVIPTGISLQSDKDMLLFHQKNDKELVISSHTVLEEGISYSGSTMSKPKLTAAIKYMIDNPDSMVIPSEATTSKLPDVENAKEDLTERSTASEKAKQKPKELETPSLIGLPDHIVIPKGIKAPFSTGSLKPMNKDWLLQNYKELFAINNDTLLQATPEQLFMLMQLTHPSDYGIAVDRSTLLKHFEKYGASVFKAIGYPAHPEALYANLYTGFKKVTPLKVLLGDNPNGPQWWYVAESQRPIGDIAKAIQFLSKEKEELIKKQLSHTNEKTQKPKSNAKDKEAYKNLSWEIEDLNDYLSLLELAQKPEKKSLQNTQENSKKEKKASYTPSSLVKDYVFFSDETAENIRIALKEKRLPMPFSGRESWDANCTPLELINRWGTTWDVFETMYQKPLEFDMDNLKKKLEVLKGKRTGKAKLERENLAAQLESSKKLLHTIEALVHDEFLVFQDELFEMLLIQTKKLGYDLGNDSIADFKEEIMPQLLEDHQIAAYANEPIQQLLPKLLKWYFENTPKPVSETPPVGFDDERLTPDYMVRVLAHMQDQYIEAKRLTKKQIEGLLNETGTPNLGMLWEAVELSWLHWYKMYYSEHRIFEHRLASMIRFWDKVQPTYAYSDSSKELYKQYSTPCPIGAMIAQYTGMDTAKSIFEPSAGNGLLLVGAKPEKCHVNEIDKNRRQSLMQQQFKTITHWNAAAPFPEELTRSFDVVVTNPPFAKWEADRFDKEQIVTKYFAKHQGLDLHLRLEHLMSGLALHTLKDNGKAALIIMGHITFEENSGYISRYRPFLNWLYRHYRVDDIINLNSYKMYNKQGATREVMLILIGGRKSKPKGAAPKFKDAPDLAIIENSFEDLWQRIKSHIKSPIEKLIQQLKTANRYDLL